jgi:predicted adenylyl cyclase CyaB
MSLEIEKRFINFDYKTLKQKLKDNEIKKTGEYLFKLSSYEGTKKGQSIRIRDEGDKITFTIKQKNEGNYDTEWEVIINDYTMLDKMLQELNVKKRYDLHKYREIYKTKNNKSEIVFDHFPGLPPYIEIESNNEKELFKTMKLLDVNEEEDFTAKDLYFKYYGITKDRKDGTLTFKNAKDVLSDLITKNKKDFLKILKVQIKKYKKK